MNESLATGWKVRPGHSALVIVDMVRGDADPNVGAGLVMQRNGSFNHYYFDRVRDVVIPNLKQLLAAYRAQGQVVIHAHYYGEHPSGGDWPRVSRDHIVRRGILPSYPGLETYEWMPGLEPVEGEYIVFKRSVSAFGTTMIETLLRRLELDSVVMTGVTTNLGVGHCACDAADRDFQVTLVDDACAAFSESTHTRFLNLNNGVYFHTQSTAGVISDLNQA